MSVGPDPGTARVTRLGFAGLLIFAGAIFIYTQWRDEMPVADLLVCLVAIGLGIALLLRWWVARWLALGVCFLLIVAAIVLPVLVFLRQPPGTSSGAVFSNALFAVVMLAFGGIGYRCLGYFRSQAGRRDYAGDPDREQRMMEERSSAVVTSAAVWAVFIVLACIRRHDGAGVDDHDAGCECGHAASAGPGRLPPTSPCPRMRKRRLLSSRLPVLPTSHRSACAARVIRGWA